MDTNDLKNSLLGLKSKLQNIEKDFSEKVEDVEQKEIKAKRLDEEIDFLVQTKNQIIKLNIGGKVFHTKIPTLLNMKESLFYKIITEKKEKNEDLNEEVFFDRSYQHFEIILNYLRTSKIALRGLSKYDAEEILCEARFYGLSEIVIEAEDLMKEVEFVSFTWNGQYSNGGTNKLEDLLDRSLLKGFCINSPGWITIELNYEHEVESIEVGGYNGNTSLFACSNGASAKILTSVDGSTFTEVGKLPTNHGNTIQNVKLNKSLCKYIKFQHTSYLGIGFLQVNRS